MTYSRDSKQKQRHEAKQRFFVSLERMGGLYSVGEASRITKLSEDEIINQAEAGEIIALKSEKDAYVLPGFQFHKAGTLPHFNEVMEKLSGASNEAKCTFFLNPILLDSNVEKTPWEILQDECSQRDLGLILREASLFLSPVAS